MDPFEHLLKPRQGIEKQRKRCVNLFAFAWFGWVQFSMGASAKCHLGLLPRQSPSPHTVHSLRRAKRNIPGICFKLPAVALFVLMFVEVEMRKVFGQAKEQKLVEKNAQWSKCGPLMRRRASRVGKSDGAYFIFVAAVQKASLGQQGRGVAKFSLVIKASAAYL